MTSDLPITGSCHYCGAPCKYRFCDNNHGRLYWYRQQHPEVKKVTHRAVKPGNRETMDDRINRIVMRERVKVQP
jgi:hypothetical protein